MSDGALGDLSIVDKEPLLGRITMSRMFKYKMARLWLHLGNAMPIWQRLKPLLAACSGNVSDLQTFFQILKLQIRPCSHARIHQFASGSRA